MSSIQILHPTRNRHLDSSGSFTTSVSTLSSKKIPSLSHRPTLTNLTKWVSRKISRQKLSQTEANRRWKEDGNEDQVMEDAYAAYCRAFTEGRMGEYQSQEEEEQEEDNELGGLDSERLLKGERRAGENQCKTKETVLRHEPSAQSVRRPLDGGEDSMDFHPIGFYGYNPLGASLSPPPRILTPAIYAETNRVEKEQRAQKQRISQRKGFFRSLWLHLRRSRS
ncbi:hypothetical protein BDV28DRAFT_145190 [Aspergillus coremiiformis]|uniref:Uncharacterized protein n=1 Tax=Aspergillus coremiiformis TaxID=138285 RepID=A0A5N6ZK09_9EURO|nr:hypothetical protein BDV28DRAFT_145190 [Aspergillus coremiiformis]